MNLNALIQVLLKSFKGTLSSKLWKWLIGSSSAIFALLLFGKNFLNVTLKTSIKIGLIIILGIFVLRFFLFIIINSFKYLHNLYRDSKYGDAIVFLRDAFSKVHYYRQSKNKSDELFIKTMVYMCDSLQNLFSSKNACMCSVSIKVPVKGDLTENTSVMNLCRDNIHSKVRDNANYKAVDHTIIGNTAFRKSLNNVLRNNPHGFHYLNNNISDTKDYDNTSKEVYPNGKLPYESEIVVPIIPFERDSNRTFEALGFLCVDCISKNKFDEKYDVPLLEGVADGIYDILLVNKSNH